MTKFSMKNTLPKAGQYVASSAGAVAASAVLSHKKVFPGKKKWVAAAVWGGGLINAMFNPEQYSCAFINGAGAIAAIHATAAFTKKPDIFGVDPTLNGLGSIDWEKLAKEATAGVDGASGADDEVYGASGADDEVYGASGADDEVYGVDDEVYGVYDDLDGIEIE